MSVTYAGVALTHPMADMEALIAVHGGLAEITPFNLPSWTGLNGRLAEYGPAREGKLGRLLWPTGASRFAQAHFTATQSQLDAIKKAIPISPTGSQAAPAALLKIWDEEDVSEETTVETEMYLLPPWPLFNHDDADTDIERFWLLTFVDVRYFWWQKVGDIAVDGGETTWATLVQRIMDSLGVTDYTLAAVDAAYLKPHSSLASPFEYLPPLLDAVAYSIGRRVVRWLDGTVVLQTPQGGRTSSQGLLDDWREWTLQGGSMAIGDDGEKARDIDLWATAPASVTMSFPQKDIRQPGESNEQSFTVYRYSFADPCDPIETSSIVKIGTCCDDDAVDVITQMTADLEDLAVTEYRSQKQRPGSHLVRNTAIRWMDGDDGENDDQLEDLLNQWAKDWYRWQLSDQYRMFPTIVPWEGTGMAEFVEWQAWPKLATRVVRPPLNDMANRAYQFTSIPGVKPYPPTEPFPARLDTVIPSATDVNEFGWTEMEWDADTNEIAEKTGGMVGTVASLFIAHASARDDASATTAAVDTTGANLLIAVTAYSAAVSGLALNDSKGNTWTALTQRTAGGAGRERVYYCFNPIVGTGHTVTLSGATLFGSVCFAAFSGAVASPFDAETGAGSASTSTQQPGILTPSEANELLIASLGFSPTGTVSIDDGFTITDQIDAGTDIGSALAFAIKTAATNPTFTKTGTAGQMIAGLTAFKSEGSASERAWPASELNNASTGVGSIVWMSLGFTPADPARVSVTKTAVGDGTAVKDAFALYVDAAVGGTYSITWDGIATTDIAFNATSATLKSELETASGLTLTAFSGSGTKASPWTFTISTADYDSHEAVPDGNGLKDGSGFRFDSGSSGGGAQGYQGFQGSVGTRGFQGFQGLGAQGFQGFQSSVAGPQGFQGVGNQGFQGNRGFQGDVGVGGGSQGFQGFQGNTGAGGGAQGFQGFQGLGSQGFQGVGNQGFQGFQGNVGAGGGAQGFQGYQGVIGFQGTGDRGFQGFQGIIGSQGFQGFQGNVGAGGGAQGFQGFQGNTGPGGGAQGFQGFQNVAGSQGFQGLGAQGFQGFQSSVAGPQGFQGNIGSQGFQGLGNQGFQGSVGSQGFQGFSGTFGGVGSTWILENVTSTDPAANRLSLNTDTASSVNTIKVNVSNEIGFDLTGFLSAIAIGDLVRLSRPFGTSIPFVQAAVINVAVAGGVYTVTIDSVLLGSVGSFTTGDTYLFTVTKRGPIGVQGFQGVGNQGFQGNRGFQGFQGNVGSQGFQGFQSSIAGPQGFQGIGNQGFQGIGNQGFQGNVGSQGFQGNIGSQGFQGFQGAGNQGFQGNAGSQGSLGSTAMIKWTCNTVGSLNGNTDAVTGTFALFSASASTVANDGFYINSVDAQGIDHSTIIASLAVGDFIHIAAISGNSAPEIFAVIDSAPNFAGAAYNIGIEGGGTGTFVAGTTYGFWFTKNGSGSGGGSQGFQGSRGFQGDNGFQGNRGFQGDVGVGGGSQGLRGFQGDYGDFGGIGSIWFFDNASSTNPPTQYFATNSATASSITTLKIHKTDFSASDWTNVIGGLSVGDRIRIAPFKGPEVNKPYVILRVTSKSLAGSIYTITCTNLVGTGTFLLSPVTGYGIWFQERGAIDDKEFTIYKYDFTDPCDPIQTQRTMRVVGGSWATSDAGFS